jgi:hypothetical protein
MTRLADVRPEILPPDLENLQIPSSHLIHHNKEAIYIHHQLIHLPSSIINSFTIMATDHTGDSDSDSDYEPEYEPESFQVAGKINLQVLSVVPPPLEFMSALHSQRQEISGRQVWCGSLLCATVLCQLQEQDNDLFHKKRWVKISRFGCCWY